MIIKQVGKKAITPIIKLNNIILKKVQKYKYLGLILTENLTWTAHIENVIEKVAPIIGAIKRCRHMLDKNSRYLLYNSFIEPHIRYLIACYGNANLESLNKLQRLQNKAIKTIFSLNYYTPSEIIYKNYPFLQINEIKQHEQAKLIYKIKNNQIKTNVILRKNKYYYNYQLITK